MRQFLQIVLVSCACGLGWLAFYAASLTGPGAVNAAALSFAGFLACIFAALAAGE